MHEGGVPERRNTFREGFRDTSVILIKGPRETSVILIIILVIGSWAACSTLFKAPHHLEGVP